MLEVDKVAEDHCSRFLTTHFGNDHIRVLGEETLWKFKGLDLTTHHLEGYGNNNTQIVEGAETRLTAIIGYDRRQRLSRTESWQLVFCHDFLQAWEVPQNLI